MTIIRSIIAAVSLLTGVAAHAHDLLILSHPGHVEAKYGHPGDWQYTDREKLIDLRVCRSVDDCRNIRELLARDGLALKTTTGAGSGTVVVGRYDNGVWVKMPDGTYRNARPSIATEAVDSLTSVKYAKALSSTGAHAVVFGHALEIVPVEDPFSLQVGQTLHVRILLDGKPLAGARVENGDGVSVIKEENIKKYEADAAGVAAIPIVRAGWQLLAVDFDRPSVTPAVARLDKIVATLSFHLTDK